MKNLIFTDLDGTLLDLETYSAEKVRKHVKKLKEAGYSIIFCSSKTWAEQVFYQDLLDLNESLIVENGSGLFLPKETELFFSEETQIAHARKVIRLGRRYDEIVKIITSCEEISKSSFKCYNKLSIKEIAEITGLDYEAAKKAKTRDFSETIFDADTASESFQRFEKEILSRGLQCMPGSRFITIIDQKSNKGLAVSLMIEMYKRKYPKVRTIGIGDSRNDLEMLEVVDFPYLVKKPDNSWAAIQVENLTKISAVGPDGWNLMAAELLAE